MSDNIFAYKNLLISGTQKHAIVIFLISFFIFCLFFFFFSFIHK